MPTPSSHPSTTSTEVTPLASAPSTHGLTDETARLRRLLSRCVPAVRDAEFFAREVMCQEGADLYRTLLNDMEQEGVR